MQKIDGLLLIDCFDESFIEKHKVFKFVDFYERLLKFTSQIEFDIVLFSSQTPTHQILTSYYKDHVSVQSLFQLKTVLKEESSILVGGAAWHACLHSKIDINFSSIKRYYKTFSHPDIVDSHMFSSKIITEKDFYEDDLKWIKENNIFRLV